MTGSRGVQVRVGVVMTGSRGVQVRVRGVKTRLSVIMSLCSSAWRLTCVT